jgi:carboxylesterase type B
VLKEPVFDALARTKSQASDIPIVVGTMRQEIECLTQLPLDLIANFTCAQYMTFLRNWPGTVSKIADKLNDLYPCETMGAYKAIVTLASDIRAVCSNIHMAHVLAKSNSSRTLYFYNSPHHLLNYYYKYAFHSLDISMMLYNYDDMKKWMVPADYQYAELLFESLTTFAKEGVMAKGSFWRQFGTKERYYTNVLEIPPSVVENFNQEACDYLSSVGFDTSWWTGE